jgi:nucleoside-diphosphate-sugar epimerase
MATYLVTGGAGFIGSNIVDKLLERGDAVKVLDNFSTGREENVKHFAEDVELIRGDIRDAGTVDEAVRGCDFVIHQAALASVPRSIDDPTSSNQVNVQGILNLLEAAVKHSIARFVYASSSSVYGDSETLPKVETMPTAPKSPYAVTKLCGEWYCRVFGEIHGLTTVSLRYFNVFGPRQDPNSQYSAVIPLFVKNLLQGTRATIFGDGEQTRDFTYVNNVIDANLLSCEANISGAKVYNVACGDRFSLNRLYGELSGLVGASIEPEFAPSRTGDVKHSMADIEKISADTGYSPGVGFEDGLRRTVDWYRDAGVEALG